MATYLLDANHASPLVTLHHRLRKRVLAEINAGQEFAVCVPVFSEIWFGISLLPRATQNRQEWKRLQPYLTCYHLDETDAESAAELQILLRRNGRQLETVDALIAAIAIRYDLILLTKDKDFQPIPNLKMENWLSVTNT